MAVNLPDSKHPWTQPMGMKSCLFRTWAAKALGRKIIAWDRHPTWLASCMMTGTSAMCFSISMEAQLRALPRIPTASPASLASVRHPLRLMLRTPWSASTPDKATMTSYSNSVSFGSMRETLTARSDSRSKSRRRCIRAECPQRWNPGCDFQTRRRDKARS